MFIYDIELKKKEWSAYDYEEAIKEASEWFRKYPECWAKHGEFSR